MSQAEQQPGRDGLFQTGDPSVATSAEQLVRAREARGLAVSDLAARLGMVPRQILAIERGDWSVLPGRSFARSALRSYGRVLSIDITPLLASIDQAFGESPEYVERPALDQPMPRRGVLGFSASGSGNWLAWSVLIVAALVVLAFFYGGGASLLSLGDGASVASRAQAPAAGAAASSRPAVSGGDTSASSGGAASEGAPRAAGSGVPVLSGAAASSATAAAASSAPAVAAAPPSAAGSGGLAASSPGLTPVAAPGMSSSAASGNAGSPTVAPPPAQVANPSGSDRSRAAADSQAAAQTAAAAAGRSLALSFAEPSWIEVRDASGRVLVTGTQPAGSSTVIEGPLPLSAVIGNAGRVTATWRGAPFDLNPHLRQGVARFNIE
jgi:cytoskeleton protein RodZ